MQYSDQNREGLMGLLAGLKAGMNPETTYGLYQDIQENQMARVAARQERLSGLAGMLMDQALAGQTYEGAAAMAEAAPGPAGPAVQNMLSSLYPEGYSAGEGPVAPTNASGAVMDFPSGSRPGDPLAMAYGAPQAGPTAQSPAFQPPQPSATEQMAMQEQAQAASLQEAMAQVVADAQAYKRAEKPMDQFLTDVAGAYPDIMATPGGIEQVQQIALTIFNAPTAQGA